MRTFGLTRTTCSSMGDPRIYDENKGNNNVLYVPYTFKYIGAQVVLCTRVRAREAGRLNHE